MTVPTRLHGLARLGAALALVAAGLALGGADKQGGGAFEAQACYDRALETTTLNTNDAVALCTGARGDGPLRCYLDGEDATLLSQQDLVVLCRCADGSGPVRCYERAQRTATLTQQQIVELCSPSVQGTLYPSCEPAGTRPPDAETE